MKEDITCDKCNHHFKGTHWERGKTYRGIDEHHNPPKFMVEKWNGKIYNLCRKCYRELHDEIIKILNKFSVSLKFNKSEYWTWIKILPKNRSQAIKEVFEFTEGWVNDT